MTRALPLQPAIGGSGAWTLNPGAGPLHRDAVGWRLDQKQMMPVQTRYRPTVGQLARAHTFRFLTMIAAWVLIFAAFIYHPEWIRESLRFMTHSIETIADQVPEPWGARIEIMLRELGGIIWLQIAIAIVVLRLVIWVPFHLWRLGKDRGRS